MQTNGGVVATLDRLEARARRRDGDDGPLLAAFVRRYFAESSPDDVADRAEDDLYGAAVEHWQLGLDRAAEATVVRVVSPDIASEGWHSSHSVLMLVTADAPFLVDSVRIALDRLGVAIHLMIHPTLRVARDAAGRMVELPDRGGVLEAWTLMEIDRCSAAEERAVGEAVRNAVADVHRVVADADAMRELVLAIAERLATDPPSCVAPGEAKAMHELLGWLARRHFVFLGAATYDRVAAAGSGAGDWVVQEGSRLGLARRDATLDPAPVDNGALLTISRSERRSTVHRDARITCIAVRRFDDAGAIVGEDRILGLFSSAAYRASVLAIPYVRDSALAILDARGAPPDSHAGRSLRTVLDTFPRDEIFEIPTARLGEIANGIVALQERRIVKAFAVDEPAGRWATVLVYLPRSRFAADTPAVVSELVVTAYGADAHDVDTMIGTSALARITVRVRRVDPAAAPDLERLSEEIDRATTPWADRLREELIERAGEERGIELHERIGVALPAAYRAVVDPRAATSDVERIAALVDSGADVDTALVRNVDAPAGEWRLRIYRRGRQATLDELLPLLDQLGLRALDERPFSARVADEQVWLYDIGVRLDGEVALDDATSAELRHAFAELDAGRLESDGFNRLVVAAHLTVRQVDVIRAYGRYMRQIGVAFSQAYVEATLAKHAALASRIARLFDTRFDPAFPGDRAAACAQIEAEVLRALDDVPSLDEDRIVRGFVALIGATVRTNAFRPPDGAAPASGGGRRPVLALKLDPAKVPDLPAPRPRHEIWVSSPRVEGVHLRGGAIARGGIRWSDRREDFRTEVLGLMKAQMVKNAVIVPVGAKGGFVVKRPPADPEALRAEVVAAYSDFIGGLLDLTDDIVDGAVVAPASTVRYDGDDPYLVVAADKGTATFSDIANQISTGYGFWLDDAFASGGSAGYDHKAMGITARGAWESVRRHARTLGMDADRDQLTVVGVGDMSGDVFGNGLLRSPHVRLLAAFDHRHVFVDPSPDPAASFGERRRLFELARSSWADYDPDLISAGGAVFPRTAKSIELSPEARAALGTEITTCTPNELISAILRAPVDLLWNGGIGTYVKAAAEADADVGDRANDAVRVDGRELRARMVGEGGNLGFTQRARVEYALAGGLINTDAIDNSAGVDCSDHEVNIKIALGAAVAAGDLTVKQRNELLATMTDEVAEHVLADNQAQTLALSIARQQALPMVNVHRRYLDVLAAEGVLDRALEHLPDDKQLAERQANGLGLVTA